MLFKKWIFSVKEKVDEMHPRLVKQAVRMANSRKKCSILGEQLLARLMAESPSERVTLEDIF